MQRKMLLRLVAAGFFFAAPAALAHTGVGGTAGLVHGLTHPFMGADHMLAMAAVGLWAAQRGGSMLWLAPLVFLNMVALAAIGAAAGVALPHVEVGITSSVIVFGLLLAAGERVRPWLGVALMGGFAVFHGYAHGSEMPAAASGVVYGAGFLLATAALQALGVLTGVGIRALASERALLISGAALAGCGLYLMGA